MSNAMKVITPVLLVLVLFNGCASKQEQKTEQTAEYFTDCTFPDSPNAAAPGWVCDEPVSEYPVSAVGSASPSAAGYDFMKDQAATAARVRLAQQMEVHVMNMVKQYVESTGVADSETVDQVRTSVSKVVTDQTLLGSRIIGNRTSPNGYLYVLVGIDEKNTAYNAQKALLTSMGNDEALWQEFKAQKGFDELATEIANTK
ncbi:LPP20 family lipoprotein [Gynuella sp.]|uniref:LPP20 family lipoprotein n=1 Tax=Gynuella sp. TaxID=2969146 RepID=UPI003D0B92F6